MAPLQHPSVYSDCNVNCSCSTEAYDPVCADGGVQYFNPCLTGCTQAEDKDGQKVALHCIAFEVFYLLCFSKGNKYVFCIILFTRFTAIAHV